MKKLFKNMTAFIMIAVMMFGVLENAQALGNNLLISAPSITTPLHQVVVYQSQSVSYDNFDAAIFAQGQLGEAAKLPASSEVALYVDSNKVNGPAGLQTGTRCSAVQASVDYDKNTITMDKRFCIDFNDAILDGRTVYGVIPTEAVFLHNANSERCYVTGNGGAVYMINPASAFLRSYLVNRGSEKLKQFNLDTFFLDNLQAGWNGITARCGGIPKEYSNSSDYLTQMVGLATYVHDNLPLYKIEGNLGGATSQWDKFVFLDGAMCENCFTNWGSAWPSAARMLADLVVMDKWIKGGHKIYIISQAPDTSADSNRFTFAASLLVANDNRVNFHFGSDYGQFYPLPEYQYNLGIPLAERICSGNTCVRQYEHGTVMVDFGMLQGTILMKEPTPSQTTPVVTLPPTSTPTATQISTSTATYTPTPTALPYVTFIIRANPSTTNLANVDFNVTFSESVTGIDVVAPFNDFALTKTGASGASITGVSRSGITYTVTVNTGTTNGTIRLDVVDDNSIIDAASNLLGGTALGDGNFTVGEVYVLNKFGGDTVGVFRPTNGKLFLRNTNTTGIADIYISYGLPGDYPVVGDWDGNGTATIGIYRNGKFYLRNSNTLGFADLVITFGTPGDQPVAGDWNGDGVDTIGVYNSATGQFQLRNINSNGPADLTFNLGNSGDIAIAGDWNGDGFDTVGVFRPGNGNLFLKNINTTGMADVMLTFGLPGDKPITGDWDNDGADTIGVYRGNKFFLRNSNTNGFADITFNLGNTGDMPIVGNWDGIP